MKYLLPFILFLIFLAIQPPAIAAAKISPVENSFHHPLQFKKAKHETGRFWKKLTSVFSKKKTGKHRLVRFRETNSRYGSIAIILLTPGIVPGLTLSWWLLAILGSASLFFAFVGARYDRKKKWSTSVFVIVGLAAFLLLVGLVFILIACWGPNRCD